MDWQNREEVKKRVQEVVEKYWYVLATLLVVLGIFLLIYGFKSL